MKLSWVHSISPQKSHHRLESPRATWAKPVRRGITRWSMRVWSVPSGFIKIVLDVCSIWVPLSAFVLRSPAEVNLSPLGGDDTSSSPPLAGSQTFGQFHRSQRLAFGGGQWPNHIQRVQPKDEGCSRATLGFGDTGSSLPSCPSLSLDNLLYREDFPWSTHRVGVTLVQAGFTGLSPDV